MVTVVIAVTLPSRRTSGFCPGTPNQALIPPLAFSVRSFCFSVFPASYQLLRDSRSWFAGRYPYCSANALLTKFTGSLLPFSPAEVDDNTEESDESCVLAFSASFQFTACESLGLRSGSCWFDSICETRSTRREVSLKQNTVTGYLFRAIMSLSR